MVSSPPSQTPAMMAIMTIVLSGPIGAVEPGKTNYGLKWRLTQSKQEIFGIETGHNDGFLQVGLDKDCQHSGKAIEMTFMENCWRMTITLRGYCNPTVNLPAWLERCKMCRLSASMPLIGDDKKELIHNVLYKFENPHEDGEPAKAKLGQKTMEQVGNAVRSKGNKKSGEKLADDLLLSHVNNQDVYGNCPWKDIPEDNKAGLSDVPPILAQRQPLAVLYLSWPMQQVFLKHHIVVCLLAYDIDDEKKRDAGIPLVFESQPMFQTGSGRLVLPKPMYYYAGSAMQMLANVKHTNRSKPIICDDHAFGATTAVFTCKNRIDHDSARQVLLGQAKELYVAGSGGAGHAVGQAGAPMSKGLTVETDAWGYGASPQDTHTNKINQVLLRCAENSQMIDVWMGADLVFELGKEFARPMKAGQVLHVGRFYCFAEETNEGKTSAETDALKRKEGLDDHLSYQLRSHKTFKLRMVDEDWFEGLYYDEESEGTELAVDWRVLTITDRPGEFADLRLPKGDQNVLQHAGVGGDYPMGVVSTQLEYHYEQHIAPWRDSLPRVDKMPVIGESDPTLRADSKPWIMQRDKLLEENPFAAAAVNRPADKKRAKKKKSDEKKDAKKKDGGKKD